MKNKLFHKHKNKQTNKQNKTNWHSTKGNKRANQSYDTFEARFRWNEQIHHALKIY